MKKLLSLVIVLTLVLSMGVVAFGTVYTDVSQVEINKSLDAQGENPAETFSFTVGDGVVKEGSATAAPAFTDPNFDITVGQGAGTGSVNINLPVFPQVGVYEYPITETLGNTAGFDYEAGPYYLQVTVINGSDGLIRVVTLADEDGIKNNSFENSFDSGNLKIKKVIDGNIGDPNDTFTVTVTLTPVKEKVLNSSAIVADGGDMTIDEETGVVTIVYTVKNGSEYTIQNIPYDVNYAVVETGTEDYNPKYEVSYDDDQSGEMDNAAIETTITNTRNTQIETGINLDNLPYILILATATIGLFGFTMKKRFNNQ